MSFIDKIKKIFKEEKVEEKQIKKISFEQLPTKINEKLKEGVEKTERIKKEITEKITNFDKEIFNALGVLEQINIEERKEHEKLKLVVRENLSLYINYLKRFLHNLKKTENLEIEEQIKKIFAQLNEFEKISYLPYEKATILIGKELENVKILIKEFKKGVNKVAEENKTFFEETLTLNQLNSILQELKHNKTYTKELEIMIEDSNNEINKIKEEIKKIERKINEIKSNDEYKKDLEEKEKHARDLNELEKEILALKQKIDFRLLAKYFHYDKKKSQLIRHYSENFKSALENDKELEIISLVKQAQNIELNSLNEIQKKLSELNKSFTTKTDNEILSLEEELKKFHSRILSIELDIQNELKKKERLIAKKEKISQETKELAKKVFFNFEIEDL